MDSRGVLFELKGLKEARELFSPVMVSKAIRYALNRSGNAIKTDIVKEISKTYNMKQKDLREKMVIGKAYNVGKDNELKITIRGARIPLSKFPVSEQMKGIVAKIRRDKPTYYERGFTHKYVTGTKTSRKGKIRLTSEKDAFQRVGKTAYPIWTLYGPSVPQLVGSDYMMKIVQEVFSTRMQKDFIQGVNYYSGMVKTGIRWAPEG